MSCECHDSNADHERWLKQETIYWSAYFGDSIRHAVESERFYREEGFIVNNNPCEFQNAIQRRLK